MDKRHKKLGIKQTIQKHWMDRTVQMMLAGMSEREIRAELDEFLKTQKQSGGISQRGEKTYGMAIGILASWFAPDSDLVPFRNDVLTLARSLPTEQWLPLHWIIISASYPFWFNVARQVGRLFNLQNQITQAQVFGRIKEQYGDRETVARNARYTVRSFVAWGILKNSQSKGCYEKFVPISITDSDVTILMFESALYAVPEAKGALNLLLNNPAFFPFQIPIISGDYVSQCSDRLEVVRYGLDDILLVLKKKGN
ncbi:MAG: hypothetical protein J5I83_10955 [Nitrosomonas communis]|nr:hypothetical protein [Nitrosomonas communis]